MTANILILFAAPYLFIKSITWKDITFVSYFERVGANFKNPLFQHNMNLVERVM